MEVGKFAVGKTCLAGAIAVALLTACGGGGGGGGKGGGGDGGGGGNPVTVSGAAVKGIIKNGIVSIYGVSNGVPGTTPLVTGRTSSTDGSYSLQVNGYSGPVVVAITADSNSRMVCDIPDPAGCGGDVGFGEDYTLGDEFVLRAVVPQVTAGGSVTANVTALTNMAAALAEEAGITAQSANVANSQVANLFGITADLTTLEPLDVTDPEALADATDTQRRAALLSASILAAAAADNSSLPIEEALTEFSNSFAANQGQLINHETSNSSTTTLAEIFRQTDNLVTHELSDVDELDQVADSIGNNLTEVEGEEPGSVTDALPNDDYLSDGVAKARALVQDLRDVSTAATFDEISEGATEFADDLKAASEVINDDTRRAVDALTQVAEAISQAAFDGIQAGDYEAENGLVIAVTTVEGVPHYAYQGGVVITEDGQDYDVMVSLTGIGHIDLEENVTEVTNGETENVDLNADLNLVGVITTPSAVLTIHGASDEEAGTNIQIVGMNETSTETQSGPQYSYTDRLIIETLALRLNVTLAQREVGGGGVVSAASVAVAPVSFNGDLEITVTGLDTSSELQHGAECLPPIPEGTEYCNRHVDASKTTFETLDLSLHGEFSQGEQSFAATFTLNAENNGYIEDVSHTWQEAWGAGGYSSNSVENESEETAQEFVAIAFTLNMNAVLTGISDEVDVTLSGNRNALETGTASLELAWDGKRLDADVVLTKVNTVTAAALTITNQDGATLAWNDSNVDDDNDVIQGVITADGAQQATFAEENEVVVIRYNGGYVESF